MFLRKAFHPAAIIILVLHRMSDLESSLEKVTEQVERIDAHALRIFRPANCWPTYKAKW
jgi:hypothetical protein